MVDLMLSVLNTHTHTHNNKKRGWEEIVEGDWYCGNSFIDV